MELKDRVVLITGGARGLGYATAQAMAREGARVIINDLRGDAAMQAASSLGNRHIGVPGDVSKEVDVNDMVALAIKEAGRIDILVNNAGIGMLTRTLGCEWAPHRIRVNAVAPGYILTEMVEKMIAEKKLDQTRILRRTPMGKWGRPEHVAEAILFLASDRARFITGVTLPVDGGYMAWGAPSDAYPLADLPGD